MGGRVVSQHIYDNKGVRLYYELPDEGFNYVKFNYVKGCIEDLYSHMQRKGEVSSRHINQLLAGMRITTVDFEGGNGK
jgi:hypothetical protein